MAIAHPLRRAILEACLLEEEVPVARLVDRLQSSPSALSQHLRNLKDAGLLADRKEGRNVYVRITPEPLLEVIQFVDHVKAAWEARLDRLGAYLAERSERKAERSARNPRTKGARRA